MFHPWLLVLLTDGIVVVRASKLAGSLVVSMVDLLLFVGAHSSLIVFRSRRRWSFEGREVWWLAMVVCSLEKGENKGGFWSSQSGGAAVWQWFGSGFWSEMGEV
ncbi:hypothetical protein AABB24_029986 [Solanum stoloniferum]|uniref:Uncharacterized protein n=1 Tax=Solanum stoloniferum TaxID=62892 RepID=A0ABD2S0K7_9SOLN